MKTIFKKSISFILASIILLSLALSLTSCNPFRSKELNLDGYELVFVDEFEGDEVDFTIWETHYPGPREAGFAHDDQVSTRDGNLVITGEYAEKEYGDGWYIGMIHLKEKYKYGYFEIRCITNPHDDIWSAFWLQHEDAYNHDKSNGGLGGAEVDIFETFKDKNSKKTKDKIFSSIHCNGKDKKADKIDSKRITTASVPNITTEYNTFGLMWTEDEYIFYLNGKETARSSFGEGTAAVPEMVVVSLAMPDEITLDKSIKTEFLVDYVKIYQLKD